MANAWNVQRLRVLGPSFSGVVTNEPISDRFGVTSGGATTMRVDIDVSGVTQIGIITISLQDSSDGSTWETKKASAAITADGQATISLLPQLAGDQTYLPLRQHARLVLTTTTAGDAATIDQIRVSQTK